MMMNRLRTHIRTIYAVAVPLAVLLFGGSAAAHIAAWKARRTINSKQFIDIAVTSVDEAYRLIESAETFLLLGNVLLAAAGIVTLLIVAVWFVNRRQPAPIEHSSATPLTKEEAL